VREHACCVDRVRPAGAIGSSMSSKLPERSRWVTTGQPSSLDAEHLACICVEQHNSTTVSFSMGRIVATRVTLHEHACWVDGVRPAGAISSISSTLPEGATGL
jgi:hypothetical protein